jgi:hypothetical protein
MKINHMCLCIRVGSLKCEDICIASEILSHLSNKQSNMAVRPKK